MLPGSDSMGAPLSFTSRRPNASHLPSFELPPPQLPGYNKYQSNYTSNHSTGGQTLPTSLTSVGNLLTPPSGSSSEGLSPTSSAGITSASSAATNSMPPYTPNGLSWPPPTSSAAPYGFHSTMSPSAFAPSKSIFSQSMGSLSKSNHSPSVSDLPPPPYGNDLPAYPGSMPMSAPVSLPNHHSMSSAMSNHQLSMSAPGSHASPHSHQGSFSRPPPTPTYNTHYGSGTASAPAQSPYSYQAGPSPIQQSPVSAGGLTSMSPNHSHGQIPSLHSQHSQSPYTPQRPFSFPGPVLSNVNHPNSQMALVGGMNGNGVSNYGMGHAGQMPHLYAHSSAPPNANSERPFKCDQCPQSFNRNHDLKRHKRIHLAVKPFPCGHCDKSFSRKDALKRHILVKGCGKAHASNDNDHGSDRSSSPTGKSDLPDGGHMIPASA